MQQTLIQPTTPHRPFTRWFAPRPFDWATTFLYLSVLTLFWVRQSLQAEPRWWAVAAMTLCIVALLGLDRWEWWRYPQGAPPQAARWLFFARVALIEGVVQAEHYGLSVFLYVLLPFAAALTFGGRTGWLVGGLVWLVFFVKLNWFKPYWMQSGELINNIVIFTMALLFMLAMAYLVSAEQTERRASERLLADLERSHAQLHAYAREVEELATTSERNRLARDIHDSLGHYLTVINVQLEKSLAFRAQDAQQADQAVCDSKRLAHAALADVRRSVGILRGQEAFGSLETALRELCAPLASAGLAVSLDVAGHEGHLSAAIRLALFRGAQELLTNVQRHAQATQTTVRLVINSDQVTLTVQDNGVGFDAAQSAVQLIQHGCYGLIGLRERLALVGGTVSVHSTPGHGTQITLRVPFA